MVLTAIITNKVCYYLFVHESSLRINGYAKKKWIKNNSIFIHRTVKYLLKLNIWGCFYQDKIGSIDIFSDNMNADYYIQILENNLLPTLEKF